MQCKKLVLIGLSLSLMPIGVFTPYPAIARMTPAEALAQRRLVPPPDSVCTGIQDVDIASPAVKTLLQLIEKYKINLPDEISLTGQNQTFVGAGESRTVNTVAYYEVALAIDAVYQQAAALTPADTKTLANLKQQYNSDLFNADRSGRSGGGRYYPGGGYPAGARVKQKNGLRRPLNAPVPAGLSAPPMLAPQAGSIAPPTIGAKPQAPASASLPVSPKKAISPNAQLRGEMIFTPADQDASIRERKQPWNTEAYSLITENPFLRPSRNPLSTFSIDVDTASYSNVRRFITEKQLPPKDAVRIEELINYFPYSYAPPVDGKPFSVTTAVGAAPWNPKHQLVQIGLQGKQLETPPPSNLVFLIDVSGSMNQPNKLPLVQQSLCLLTQQLGPQDKVTMVVYAGNAGLVLPPTAGSNAKKIMAAIDQLEAGGSTAGGAGIELAYQKAQESLIKGGNNRVILATDGDFNVGVSSDAELVRLIEQKRDKGIFLTVLGFGTGNYKDAKMEQLADRGNGTFAYIDTFAEAQKVLVHDLRGTLFTIAKDVKIQVEFNPSKVQAYRLIGYENRALRDQDFNDDTKDAGEIGAGHSVTALYEIVPTGMAIDVKLPSIDDLKYQKVDPISPPSSPTSSNELMQLKLRYKTPEGNTSQLITQPIFEQVNRRSLDFDFAASVALFGMILRDSDHKGQGQLADVLKLAEQGKGADQARYRSDFIRLVNRYAAITAKPVAPIPQPRVMNNK